MKIFLKIFLVILISAVFFLDSCGRSGQENIADITDEVEISILSFSPEGITIIYTNNSETEFTYGGEFSLQVYKGKKWKDVSAVNGVEWSQDDWGKEIEPGETSESETYNWEWYYGSLSSGKYRFLAVLNYNNGNENKNITAASDTFTIP